MKRNLGVLYVSSRLRIHCTEHTMLSEARVIQLVSQHTSIPVPKIYCSFKYRGFVYILMERLPGRPLAHGWVRRSAESKARILEQLRRMIEELRTVPQPPPLAGGPPSSNVVSGMDGGLFYDGNLPDKRFWGPFATIRDFHRELRSYMAEVPEDRDDVYPGLRKLISYHEETAFTPPVLTHGDPSAFNILADGDTVTGIVDWETAAWMPAYWEYTNAWHVNPYNPYWQEEVDKFITPWPEALEMERIRRRFFDVFGADPSLSQTH